MEGVSLFFAFGAGVLSFFTPCVLPLIPAYLCFITGLSLDELRGSDSPGRAAKNLRKILWPTALFVLGFSFVFVSLGATATSLGKFVYIHQRIIEIVGGSIVILFGLHLTGVLNIKYLQYEKKFHLGRKPANIFGSFILGVVFAAGWTPCVGPILGPILLMAETQERVAQGIILLSLYSLGLGLPFLLTAIAVTTFLNLFNKVKKYFRAISLVSGLLLIIIGILIMTDRLHTF